MSDEMERRQQAVDIARLQVQVEHLTQSMADLREVNRQQSMKIDMVLEKLTEAKGGWRTLLWLGGSATTVGAGLAWLIDHFMGAPR